MQDKQLSQALNGAAERPELTMDCYVQSRKKMFFIYPWKESVTEQNCKN